jgi:hypothetical protein
MNSSSSSGRNFLRLIVDITIFLVLLLSLDRRLTGKPVHEWLPLAGTAAIILHLLLSWNWIAAVTRKFFVHGSGKQKLNYILNWLFFIDWVLVMWSGIMVSRLAMPLLGIRLKASSGWHWLHGETASLLVFILGLHLALNWAWVVRMVKSHLLQPLGFQRLKDKTGVTMAEKVQS